MTADCFSGEEWRGRTELAHARAHAGLPVMAAQDADAGGCPGTPGQRGGHPGLLDGPHRHHLPLHQLLGRPVHSLLIIHLHLHHALHQPARASCVVHSVFVDCPTLLQQC